MADFFTILGNSYRTAPTPSASQAKYVAVDPSNYTGTWKGTYSTGENFSFQISDVQGFGAKVRYQSDKGPSKYHHVLVRDNSFRIGDPKFLLKKIGHAQIKTVVTNPATGASTPNTACADLV